jgi:cytochrome oxidase Cu insertion factor (SCO1/SenC/PrrC family)
LKKIGFAIKALVVLAALIGIYVGFGAAKAEFKAYRAAQAAALYLFSPTDLKGKDGQPLTRADLLDEVLRDAIAKAQAPTPTAPAK